MADRKVSIPDILLIAGTRVALGIGIGLLISDRFNRHQRKAAGRALVAVGALTTIPLAIKVAKSKSTLAITERKHAA